MSPATKRNTPREAKNSGRRAAKKISLDRKDRLILNEIQRNFPITHRPFLALARKLKLREKERPA